MLQGAESRAMSLLGKPNLPFGQRFNLTYSASLSVIIDTLSLVSHTTARPPHRCRLLSLACRSGTRTLGGSFTVCERLAGNVLRCIPHSCTPCHPPQAVTAIYWARVGLAASAALQAFLAIHAIGCSMELAWRWQCRKASDGGSYARLRELPSLVMRLNDALLGPVVLWPRALLDRLPAADSGSAGGSTWAGATAAVARHTALLLFGSASTGQALAWAKPLRLW